MLQLWFLLMLLDFHIGSVEPRSPVIFLVISNVFCACLIYFWITFSDSLNALVCVLYLVFKLIDTPPKHPLCGFSDSGRCGSCVQPPDLSVRDCCVFCYTIGFTYHFGLKKGDNLRCMWVTEIEGVSFAGAW